MSRESSRVRSASHLEAPVLLRAEALDDCGSDRPRVVVLACAVDVLGGILHPKCEESTDPVVTAEALRI